MIATLSLATRAQRRIVCYLADHLVCRITIIIVKHSPPQESPCDRGEACIGRDLRCRFLWQVESALFQWRASQLNVGRIENCWVHFRKGLACLLRSTLTSSRPPRHNPQLLLLPTSPTLCSSFTFARQLYSVNERSIQHTSHARKILHCHSGDNQ